MNLAITLGLDLEFSSVYNNIVTSKLHHRYDIDLFAKLGLHCYNFEKGTTNFKFMCSEKYNTIRSGDYIDNYITLKAMDPDYNSVFDFQTMFRDAGDTSTGTDIWRIHASRLRCNKPVDDYWCKDEDLDDRGSIPNWLSNEALASDNKKYYVVQESELHENDWLHLYLELAFYSKLKWKVYQSPPLEIKKVVIETKEEYIREASEKLKAQNATFYISYKYKGASQSSLDSDHKAIVWKTINRKPEHES